MAREQTVFSELAVASAINGGTIEEILNISDSDKEIYLNELNKNFFKYFML